MMIIKKACRYSAVVGLAMLVAQPAIAGPFIIDGTDADDHGSAFNGVNQEGWLYIQRGLENIASSAGLTKTQKTIAVLGSDPNSQASSAVESAVSLSSALTSAGWSVQLLNDSQISDFFNNSGSGLLSTGASVLYMDSSYNVGGGLNDSEQQIIDSFATQINNFVGSGGGLFSHSQGYGWLSSLVPGLTTGDFGGDQGITLTAAGSANFPGLTNADLSSGPYHNTFSNTGLVPVLGVGSLGTSLAGKAVIIGGSGGSITNPDPTPAVPEPAAWAMMISGFGLTGASLRSRRRPTVRFA